MVTLRELVFYFEKRTRGIGIRLLFGRLVRHIFPSFWLSLFLRRLLRKNRILKIKLANRNKFLLVDLNDIDLSPDLQFDGIWEPAETSFILNYLKSGMVFIDVGAHIGYYSILAADIVGEHGRVIAFEPDPRNFKLLVSNIKLNTLHNVTAVPAALADGSDTRNLWYSRIYHGDNRIYRPADKEHIRIGAAWSPITIRSVSLDEYIDRCPCSIDMLKMDIQGAEAIAFRGMHKVLNDNPRIMLIMEFWPHGLRQAGESPDEFLQSIRVAGFHIHELNESGMRRISDEDIMQRTRGNLHMNIVAARYAL